MQNTAKHLSETASIQALLALDVLDTEPEAEFDALAEVAALACRAPIALVSLLDTDRQWFKAAIGLPGVRQTPRGLAFCAHAVLNDGLFEVPDAHLDSRFASNPLVTAPPHVRFYAGAPIRLNCGERIGTICVIDHQPRQLDAGQRQIMLQLATAVASALEGRRATRSLGKADTAAAQAAAELRFRATHDALTGLVNRTEFEAQLGEVLRLAHADGSEHSLLFVDLDDFSRVNDAGGHTVGDLALQEVARILAAFVRTSDCLARLGNDDFAIILKRCPAEQAKKVATQICERMDEFRFAHGERRFRVGASIGLVTVDQRWDAISPVLQAADSACRSATEEGGNRLCTWMDSDQSIHARHGEMLWATRIEQALDEDRFVLFAQRITPLTRCAGGTHAEVLVRMVERDGTLVPPGLFLPAAERFHLAQRIDHWVLSRAMAWLAACPPGHSVSTLSVNLSGNSVGDRNFHQWAGDALMAMGAELRSKLCLEITETAAITNMADATAFVQLVRAAGVRVALDDFGAGASSFGYLKALPVDYLKIDGQFVRTLLTDPLDDATVRCFVDVAQVMGVKTVAEFVDDPAVLARLRELGVDFAQGFLLHRPAPINELLSSL